MIRLDLSRAYEPSSKIKKLAEDACRTVLDASGEGNGFLGWVRLPSSTGTDVTDPIIREAQRLRYLAEVVVVIGIGGSYLGTKAVQKALTTSFGWLSKNRHHPHVIYTGINLSEDYTYELVKALKEYSFGVIVVSKSGTTTEPAVAFRIIRSEMERRYGKGGARQRIIAVTDEKHGALRNLAKKEGYTTFPIADDIGGRYSVFSPVGLLPLAAAGVDIRSLMEGARKMEVELTSAFTYDGNPAIRYAAVRNHLYSLGFKTEILGVYEPRLISIGEWWRQLFGESEGKKGSGIFPGTAEYTADLHSVGQYIQQGERTLFETIISVDEPLNELRIESEPIDGDELNFLAGRRLGEVNRMAEMAAAIAHYDGGVPNIRIEIDRIDEKNIGGLLYFFEFACAVSGYTLGVNPFNQPGVEEYKRNMFALLDKPGYEDKSVELRKRVGEEM